MGRFVLFDCVAFYFKLIELLTDFFAAVRVAALQKGPQYCQRPAHVSPASHDANGDQGRLAQSAGFFAAACRRPAGRHVFIL
jgi:hypothetical protein